MTIAELVYEQVKALPEPLAREVLNFVRTIHSRAEGNEWRDLMQAQSGALAPAWDNVDDEVWNDV
jgi:hypothetical protein